MSCGIRAVELEHRKGTAGLAGARVANLSLHQQKARPCPQKSQKKPNSSFKAYTHETYKPNTKYTLKLIRHIDIIQLQSLEAFSFPLISLSCICFLSLTSIIFRATVKSLQYSVHPAW